MAGNIRFALIYIGLTATQGAGAGCAYRVPSRAVASPTDRGRLMETRSAAHAQIRSR